MTLCLRFAGGEESRFLKPAVTALRKHKTMSLRIREKIAAYAETPEYLANRVTELRGSSLKRLGIGDFRVLFEETATEIIVARIGPRGSVHEGFQ